MVDPLLVLTPKIVQAEKPHTQTLDDIIETNIDDIPLHMAKCDFGPGQKILAVLPCPTDPSGKVMIFSEMYFPARPKNPLMGWNPEEAITHTGVMVTIRGMKSKPDRQPPMEVISMKEFTEKYLHSKTALLKLERYVEKMEEMVELNEEFVASINQLWMAREKGVDQIGGPRWFN